MLLEDLGNRIRERREKRGLKQTDVANALQVSHQAVSKWERGENAPDIAILGALASLLGVSTDWLLGVDSERLDTFDATVLASSVRGAFNKSRGLPARDFAVWANGVFYQITQAALRFDGVPIKYMGDQFLCFFSGSEHPSRAVQTALLARKIVEENLKIGLSRGEIYLGSVGHPDYARPDIMGEVVNLAFLTLGWAEEKTESGIAATEAVTRDLEPALVTGKGTRMQFQGIKHPVRLFEILGEER
ncbi:helix-turn-helix domain-containing protein [Candidatus Sumerlaeota bacterium]|nr:helix-turn-helix domain-containing protein [Candidatus Sumerlaeota bacterium]